MGIETKNRYLYPSKLASMSNKTSEESSLFIRLLWRCFAGGLLFLVLLFTAISLGWIGFMPTFEDLENPQKNIASEIYSDDGRLMGTFHIENRNPVDFAELSPFLVQALVAREDRRYYKHSGIDGFGLVRVAVKTLLMGQSSEGGGSTVTQQLAKNLFPRDTTTRSAITRTFALGIAKFKEWVTAVKLERNYTKEEILAMYLNTVPFGSESFGIKSAARTFFNKQPHELSVEEAALLVGVVKGPTKYSPVRNPERSFARRNSVLKKMEEEGFLTEEQYDSLSLIPVALDYRVQNHNAGMSTYLREYLRRIMRASKPERGSLSQAEYQKRLDTWENDPLYGWCNKNFKPNGEPYNLYMDGLRIYTTIDYSMQEYAETSLRNHLKNTLQPTFVRAKRNQKKAPFSNNLTESEITGIMNSAMRRTDRYRIMKQEGATDAEIRTAFAQKVPMRIFSWQGEVDTLMSPIDSIRYYKSFLRASFMAFDPHTGYVKAYVGGPDFKHFKYDGVIDQTRQVGSTIKPFLYMMAMEYGYSPCYRVPNVPQLFELPDGTPYSPAGSGKREGESVTLKWALANSENNISAWLVKQFPPEAIIELMRRMGISTPIDPVPSICVGAPDISLYEMVAAYGTFANKGIYTEPIFVTRIEDRNGNIISSFSAPTQEAISENAAYLMVNLLQGVVQGGTAIRMRYTYNLNNEIGGKTGTTQNHSDGWFMAVTPNLVAGTWVGGEDRAIHFDYLSQGQGAAMALPIFATFMQKVYANGKLGVTRNDQFERPVNFSINLDCNLEGEEAHDGTEE